ncbi:DUF2182 domain-containing protein [Azoarcus sp. L1K30]|uniref:DUF2182 domain-containing protein n=1 Tax=Azoarcus sp. L1K30 TaxID=2820277 RepID=UPI001B82E871|nr:DUF2182 domain-containing protein [Azoarcus sp. L1K30]MBR0565091.1 DUF2182 domain-containing protein [Azoarcus sp. L1K30]
MSSASPRLVWSAVCAVTAVAWVYLVAMAWGMENMQVSADWRLMPRMAEWGVTDLALVFIMWVIMMAGMMLPSTLPVMLMLQRIDAARPGNTCAWCRTAWFALGYVTVWAAFSLAATLSQWALLEIRLVSPMMESSSTYLSATLLLIAGAYQFSPLKHACLQHCRSPLGFLLTRNSDSGYRLGLQHGAYCAGCCWLLMALLFVLGVMNLLWIAVLALLVVAEKLLPRARWLPQLSGAVLIVWGAAMLYSGFVAS